MHGKRGGTRSQEKDTGGQGEKNLHWEEREGCIKNGVRGSPLHKDFMYLEKQKYIKEKQGFGGKESCPPSERCNCGRERPRKASQGLKGVRE